MENRLGGSPILQRRLPQAAPFQRKAMRFVFLINAASTLMMTGVIWFVQIVHYPLFSRVGLAEFARYETAHSNLTSLVVVPLMLLELATAAMLVLTRPPNLPPIWLITGFALVLLIWATTFFLSVPQHNKLSSGFDIAAHQTLLVTNWIRTAAWSARSVIVLYLLAKLMK